MNNSLIQWTDSTVNFQMGCKKVSEGCKYCYMYRDFQRYGRDPQKVVQVSEKTIMNTLKKTKPGSKIFTNSWSDFFIEEADPWREEQWKIIRDTPQFIWQILTKRPERIKNCLPPDWGENGYPNVWLGTTIENEKHLNRLDELCEIPATLYFVSAEPLLGPIDFTLESSFGIPYAFLIDWLILGGESGFSTGKYLYRPCEVEWMEKIISDVKANSVAKIFVKQMGSYLAKKGLGTPINKNGRIADKHGGDFDFFPDSLKLREMPGDESENTAD